MPARTFTLERAARFTWRSLVVALGIYVLVVALARLRILVLPVIVAFLIATVMLPVVNWVHGRGVPRLLSVWVVLLGSIGLFVGLFFALAPSVQEEFGDLGPTLEQGRRDVEQYIIDSPLDITREELDEYVDSAGDQLSGRGDEIASGVVAGAVVAFEVIAGVLLLVVLLFFFLKDGELFCRFGLRQVRREHHDLVSALGRRAWAAAGGYVKGTAVVATVDAVIIGIGLLIIGVPLVLPLAILTFLGAFLPLVGATAAGVVAALVALVDGGLRDALLVTGVIVVVQQVEGDVLQPLVLGRAVKLHPVVVLAVLTAGAVIGGLVGAFLAVPVTAVAVAIGSELRTRGVVGPGTDDDGAAADGAGPQAPPAPAAVSGGTR
jgi:predicted PurR-regulated permease PerM